MSPAEYPRDFPSESARAAWERSCAGKDKFPSKTAAEAWAEFMHHGGLKIRRRIPRSDWDALIAYKCKFCHECHLGHPKEAV